jgi:hypothetical protein
MTGREIAHAMLSLRDHLDMLEHYPPADAAERKQWSRAIRYVEREAERGRAYVKEMVPATWDSPR